MKLLVSLFLMNFLYAGTPALTKIAGLTLHPFQVVYWRHTLACLAFLPFFLAIPNKKVAFIDFGKIMLASFLSFTLASILQVVGMGLSQAADGAFIMAMEPIIVITLAYFFLKEKLDRHIVAGLLLAVLGFLILSNPSGPLLQGRLIGNVLFLLAVIAEASFPILLKPLLQRYSPLLIAFYCLLCASFYMLPFQWGLPAVNLSNAAALRSVVYLALGCSFLGCFLWLNCLARLTATMVALSWFIQPVFGCLYAALLLQEVLGLHVWVGGSFIFAALSLLAIQQKRVDLFTPTTVRPAQTVVRIRHPLWELKPFREGIVLHKNSSLTWPNHELPSRFKTIHPLAGSRRSFHHPLHRRHQERCLAPF